MVTVSIPKVRGKMVEKGYTISSFSKELNVDRNTLSNYLNRPEKMPYYIVDALANLLCSNSDEAAAIFFAPDLRETKVSDNGSKSNPLHFLTSAPNPMLDIVQIVRYSS